MGHPGFVLLFGWWGYCGDGWGCDAEGGAGEGEGAAGVVDDVDLADVVAGFELGEGDVELEGHGVAEGVVERVDGDQGGLVDLDAAGEELDGGEDVDGTVVAAGEAGGWGG